MFSSNADQTITFPEDETTGIAAKSMYFKVTGSATLDATRNLTITNNDITRVMMVENATTGSQSIVFRQAGGSGSTVTIPNGRAKLIYMDGTGSNANVFDISAELSLTGVAIDGSSTFTGTSLDINGNADISGDLTLSAGGDGALNFSTASSIKILDNSATALVIEEADNAYMTFVTTDSSEKVAFAKPIDVTGAVTATGADINGDADISGDLTLSAGGDGALTFANAGENSIKIPDNQASALIIEEADTAYMTFVTTNSGEKVTFGKEIDVTGTVTTDKLVVSDNTSDNVQLQVTNGSANFQINQTADQAGTVIVENGSGDLTFKANDFFLQDVSNSTSRISFNESSAKLHDGNGDVRLATSTSGVEVTGTITASSDIEVSDKTKGIIIQSPNGSRFRLEVANDGTLSTEAL